MQKRLKMASSTSSGVFSMQHAPLVYFSMQRPPPSHLQTHFPMQKRLKMVSKTSSVTSCPLTSPSATAAPRRSMVQKSSGSSASTLSWQRAKASAARSSASACRSLTAHSAPPAGHFDGASLTRRPLQAFQQGPSVTCISAPATCVRCTWLSADERTAFEVLSAVAARADRVD